jgi:hypothetical protein
MNSPRGIQGNGIDCGQRALDFLFESMMIDSEWSTREERAFKWWGHNLAQRVWAEPPKKDQGDPITLIHVETDFLRNVREMENTYEKLNGLQSMSSLYAFVYLPSEKKIKLHSTAYVYEANYGWLSGLLVTIAGLQLSDSYGYPDSQQLFEGSEWDITPHPINGYRKIPDELINDIRKVFKSAGKTPVRVQDSEYKEICKMLSQFHVLATSAKSGLTAEFHFVGDESAIERKMTGKKGVATSLFTIGTDKKHVQLGHGIYSSLWLPLTDTQKEAYLRCNKLNILESTHWTNCHMFGRWTVVPDQNNKVTVAFDSFLPAISYRPGLIANLTLSNGIRSRWASTTINAIGEL